METKAFTYYHRRPLILTIVVIIGLEAAAAFASGPWLVKIGLLRIIESIAIIGIARMFYPKAGLPGLIPPDFARGIKKGLIWSACFALGAAAVAAILLIAGYDPVKILNISLPAKTGRILLFFLAGGIIGPVAEELFFRGVIFAALRPWGAVAAVSGSSVIFLLAHLSNGGIAVTQAVGGLVFAFAYEMEKNIIVPVVIHVLGNLALFATGLLPLFF